MTLVELTGLVSVIGAAVAATIAEGHTGVLTRVTAFFGGGVVGLAVFLAILLLTAGTLARTELPDADRPQGSRLQQGFAVCLLLSIAASPILAILASSELARRLLSL